MGRHEQREHLFKLLFRIEYHPAEEIEEQISLFFQDEPDKEDDPKGKRPNEKDLLFVRQRFFEIMDKLPHIDQMMMDKIEHWSLARIGKVELALLRMTIYEILYDSDVPYSVSIDEAVEIAKKFGGQDASGRFVNAVLAKFEKGG
ncbi:MAG: transcription antitermination factor NusB [Lachnospiraceae bacterium]|jgi:N utilization substance protein B|nr:transcription antitermination factor NusB [Lachnospiraceae bacterium]